MSTSHDAPVLELTAILERFEAAWLAGSRPDLASFLPGSEKAQGTWRRQLLCELVKIDLAHRWRKTSSADAQTEPPRTPAALPECPLLEDYLRMFPELGPTEELAVDLIAEEFRIRRRRGFRPEVAEYLARFPAQALSLSRCLPQLESESSWQSGADGEATCLNEGLPRLERFVIRQRLGAGGMGVVYEAFDHQRGERVALKTMHAIEPGALYRFKQEFRRLADLSHPHLVTLYELFNVEDRWFFSMELADGVSFLKYVRGHLVGDHSGSSTDRTQRQHDSTWRAESVTMDGDPSEQLLSPAARKSSRLTPAEEARLRKVLPQLVVAVEFVHQHGLLHRDLKHSNVFVNSAGEVKLLDFGLVIAASAADFSLATQPHLAGTVAFMSPEQAASKALTPASDWYNLGVMLFEALTGRLPFTGPPLDILMAKQSQAAPSVASLAPAAPTDLAALCDELLAIDPAARPDGQQILRRLGAGPSAISARPVAVELVGRQVHLRHLQHAFEVAASGKTVLLRVNGHSGAGKTSLVQHYLDEVHQQQGVVLACRCYEQESVPFKALDGLIDALSRWLNRLPSGEAAAILPRDVASLVRLFPVLSRVRAVAEAPKSGQEHSDPQEQRQRAFAALRELLARLGDRRPLVLFSDDVQWADRDSAQLIVNLLRPPDGPRLLWILTFRQESAASSPFLQVLQQLKSRDGLEQHELTLEPLSHAQSAELVRQNADPSSPFSRAQIEQIAAESGGNPYFLRELIEHARLQPAAQGGFEPIGLQHVLRSRMRQLPAAGQALLETIAVAGRPLSESLACSAAGVGVEGRLLDELRRQRLLRSVPAEDETTWDTYHDRIRETILADLSPGAAMECHQRLARTLADAPQVEPEILARHFLGAREPQLAGQYFARAADQAARGLAFDNAAGLYRQALQLLALDDTARGELLAKLGEALSNAVRGGESADVYLQAARLANPQQALELRRLATEQLMNSGHVAQGTQIAAEVLSQVGLTMPRTPRRALVSLLINQGRLRLRGYQFTPRERSQIPHQDLARIDACIAVGNGLGAIDPVMASNFFAIGLRHALRAGDSASVVRALALDAAEGSAVGGRAFPRSQRLIRRAADVAGQINRQDLVGYVELMEGVANFLQGNWSDAIRLLKQAEQTLASSPATLHRDLVTTQIFSMWARTFRGDLDVLHQQLPDILSSAIDRGNLYALSSHCFGQQARLLALDQPDLARQELDELVANCPLQQVHVQFANTAYCYAQAALYQRQPLAAWESFSAAWQPIRRSLVLRVQVMSIYLSHFKARCALAVAAEGGPQSGEMLREALRIGGRLQRVPARWSRGPAHLVLAGHAMLSGDRARATRQLQQGLEELQAAEMALYAACTQHRLGQLVGSDAGRSLLEQSHRWFAEKSVVNPQALTDLLVPGFPRE